MPSDGSRRQVARLERLQSDRAFRAGMWGLLALVWVGAAVPGGRDGLSLPALVPAAIAGLMCAWELWAWRARGRHIVPVSTEPPELSEEQVRQVRALLAEGRDQVPAIRFVREETACGIVAAKRAVDQAAATDASDATDSTAAAG